MTALNNSTGFKLRRLDESTGTADNIVVDKQLAADHYGYSDQIHRILEFVWMVADLRHQDQKTVLNTSETSAFASSVKHYLHYLKAPV